MWTRPSGFHRYEDLPIYLQKAEISKPSWKKVMQLLRTVVIYVLKNVKHGFKHNVDSAYGVCIHYKHS